MQNKSYLKQLLLVPCCGPKTCVLQPPQNERLPKPVHLIKTASISDEDWPQLSQGAQNYKQLQQE